METKRLTLENSDNGGDNVEAIRLSENLISIGTRTKNGRIYQVQALKISWIKKLYDHFCKEN